MKYYIIAGEASGDLHGSNLMRGLKNEDPDSEFRFWGGDLMSSVGGTLVRHYRETAIMGFVEVVKQLDKVLGNLSFCKKDLLSHRPDVLILIDYPGFNFRMAKFARKHGIKVFYYIAPKVWAWKESRVKRLQKDIDKLFTIFPFEIEYFRKWNIEPIYCGNPLIDSIELGLDSEMARNFANRHSLGEKESIAILPGSRRGEIEFLLPRYREVIKRLGDKYNYLVAAAPSIEDSLYEKYLLGCNVKIIRGETYPLLKNSTAALIASGTASLEAALIGTPQVVGYGGNPLSYQIAKRLVKVNYISLGNLILDRLAFKELIQNDCNPDTLLQEVERILNDSDYREEMIASYSEIRTLLGEGGASNRVAKEMIKLLKDESI